MLKILRFQGFDALRWGLDEEVSVLWYWRRARRVVLTTSNAFVRTQASKAGMLAETGIRPIKKVLWLCGNVFVGG